MDRLEVLTYVQCWELLEKAVFGRVVFTEAALPAIRPVNVTVVGRHLLLRTRAEGLAKRLNGQVVAFEIDEINVDTLSGWSVVVTGTARRLDADAELVRLGAVQLTAWAGEGHDTAVIITPGDVQGRRIPGYKPIEPCAS